MVFVMCDHCLVTIAPLASFEREGRRAARGKASLTPVDCMVLVLTTSNLELVSAPAAGRVSIGRTSVALVEPKDWLSVPTHIGTSLPLTDEILLHLKWMMEKDKLGQDMFLIGFVFDARI